MKTAWYSKKWVIVLLHTLGWLTIFALPFLIRTSADQHKSPGLGDKFLYFYMVTRIFWIGLFYLNAHYLFHRFINKKGFLVYIVIQVLLLFILSLLHSVCFNLLVKDSPYDILNFLVFNIFTYFFIIAASTAYRMILDKVQSDKLLQVYKTF